MKTKTKNIYKELKPGLEIYEWHRKEAIKNQSYVLGIVVVLSLVSLIALVVTGGFTNLYILGGTVGFILFLFKMSNYFENKFLARFSKDLIQALFLKKGIKVDDEVKNNIAKNLKKSNFITAYDFCSTPNVLSGSNQNVHFQSSNILIGNYNIDETYIAKFKGLFFYARTTHYHTHELVLISNDFNNRELNFKPKSEFGLESFGKAFTTLLISPGSSELLTDTFKEELLEFKRKHQTSMVIRIVSDHVYLMTPKPKFDSSIQFELKADDKKRFDQLIEKNEFMFDLIALVERIE